MFVSLVKKTEKLYGITLEILVVELILIFFLSMEATKVSPNAVLKHQSLRKYNNFIIGKTFLQISVKTSYYSQNFQVFLNLVKAQLPPTDYELQSFISWDKIKSKVCPCCHGKHHRRSRGPPTSDRLINAV